MSGWPYIRLGAFLIFGTAAVAAVNHVVRDTPGVGVALAELPSPGWRCEALDRHLATLQKRAFLAWLQRSRPRSLKHYEKVQVPAGAPPGAAGQSVEDYTPEVQQRIWDEWRNPVMIQMRVCTHPTRPLESADNCLTVPPEMAVVDSSEQWLVDNTAIESILGLGTRLIPDTCPRNNYTLKFTFSPGKRMQDRLYAAIQALSDSDPGIRTLAAEALGAVGAEARPARGALQRRLRDKAPAVRSAARAALEQIRE